MRTLAPLWLAAILVVSFVPSLAGPALGAPLTGWSAAQLIEDIDWGATTPAVALDAGGNGVAVWIQYYPPYGTWDLYGATYEPGFGWSPAARLALGGAAWLFDMTDIAADDSGNFLAVAALNRGPFLDIYAIRYERGYGWHSEALVDDADAGDARDVRIAANRDGTAIAVWRQHDGSYWNAHAARYVPGGPGTGWGAPVLLETNDSGHVLSPRVAFDRTGNATAVWTQHDGARENLWSNSYRAGVGWTGAALVETDDTGGVSLPELAPDPTGGMLVAWVQGNGTVSNILTRHRSEAAVWGPVMYAEFDDTADADNVKVGYDGSGNAILVFDQHDGFQYNAMVNRMPAGGGWGMQARLSDPDDGGTRWPALAVAPGGAAVSVYPHFGGALQVLAARAYDPASGWGPETVIRSDASTPNSPDIAWSAGGEAVAVWIGQTGSIWSEYAASFTAEDRTPPPLTVTAPLDGAHTNQTALRITGTTEPGATVVAGGVLAAVNAQGRFDFVVPLDPGVNSFTVVAQDASGNRAQVLLEVTFDDPAGALAADLAAAEADVTALQADLAAAQADLALAEANLTAAQARLAAVEADAAATEADLTAARGDVTAAQGQIAALQTALAAANARINQTSGGGSAAPADSTGMILGVLGVVLGGVALAVSFMRGGKGGGGGGGGGARPTADGSQPLAEKPVVAPERKGEG